MHLQLADQLVCYPKRVLEDAIVQVGQSYVSVDFVVLEIGGDIRAPIILGRPFLSTAKAIIYADSAKTYFTIKDRKEKFSFKNYICNLLDIHKCHTYPKRQQWPRRRTTGGGRTKPGSHKKN